LTSTLHENGWTRCPKRKAEGFAKLSVAVILMPGAVTGAVAIRFAKTPTTAPPVDNLTTVDEGI
jgi:hypothetical protein